MKTFIYRALMKLAARFTDEPPQGKFTRHTTVHPNEATEHQKKTLKKRKVSK
jgi:hypothetical protein